MHRILCATLIAGLASGLIGAAPHTHVGRSSTINELVQQSDLILVADVTKVSWGADGRGQASATPIEFWKGGAEGELEIPVTVAQRCCRTAAPVPGRELLFLKRDAQGALGITEHGRGRVLLRTEHGADFAVVDGFVRYPEGLVRYFGDHVVALGPRPSITLARCGIELSVLKRLVAEEIEAAKRAAAEAAAAAAENTPAEIR